jgi:Fe-S oxidoreductase
VPPAARICCVRPLYDFGYLDEAMDRLLSIINILQNDIHANTQIVFLEPRAAASERLLTSAGVVADALDAGCCGMAGSFGFEHVEVSRRIGERVLLPAVRAAKPNELIIAEGFSCREQIGQMTGRGALHLAEVLEEAVKAEAASNGETVGVT